MVGALFRILIALTCLIVSCCMSQRSGAKLEASGQKLDESDAYIIKGQDALDFKKIIAASCNKEEPFFDSLVCLYHVDDDGNGNFYVSRTCSCIVKGEKRKFTDSKDVLRISDIMENLHLGVPGQRPSHRVYSLSGIACNGVEVSEVECRLIR
jgi:hypothetical protein